MAGSDRGQPCKHARDAIELCPNDDTLPRILIREGLAMDFGRNLFPSMKQSFVSRQHCQLYWKSEPVLRVTPVKRTMVITSAGNVKVLEPGAFSGEMRQGDVLQLRYPPKASDSYYTYERVVQAGGVELTPQKRTLPDAVDGGSAGNENRGMPTTSATEANGQQDIFKGCVVCFTSTMHTKSLKTKLQGWGATMACEIGTATHIICNSDEFDFQKHAHTMAAEWKGTDPRSTRGMPPPHSPGSTTGGPIVSQISTAVGADLRDGNRLQVGSIQTHSKGTTTPSWQGAVHGMHVVTPEWAYASIRSQRLQPASDFPAPDFKQALLEALACRDTTSFSTPEKKIRGAPAGGPGGLGGLEAHQAALHPSSRVIDNSGAPLGHSASPGVNMSVKTPMATTSLLGAGASPRGDMAASPLSLSLLPQESCQKGQGDAATGAMAKQKCGVRAHDTGGATEAELQASIPGWGLSSWRPDGWNSSRWGVDGVWLEPFDAQSARQTLHMLFGHYSSQAAESPTMASASQLELSGARAGGLGTASQADFPVSPGTRVSKCSHTACMYCSACIVEQLELSMAAYVRGRGVDTFRMFNTTRAVGAVAAASFPLKSDDDVDRLPLGQKSNAKVKEILRHGFLEKTAALERDAAGVAYRQFCTVWGVGPRRAQVWVDRGLRTLDDVRNSEQCMAELSSRERTGLRHAADFRVRIPRQEVELAEARVREVVIERLAALAGVMPETATQGLHCRALGSYCRGKEATGDVDMMIVPGDALSHVCIRRLHSEVLQHLFKQGLATDDTAIPAPHVCGEVCERSPPSSVTWLGVCYVPGFPRVARRLDVKMYPSCQRAAAVNYFTGSGLFCRALRYWCHRPSAATAALAAQHMPGGACFHLNDCGLSVRSSSDDAATTLAVAGMHPP